MCVASVPHLCATHAHRALHADELQARKRLHDVAQISAASNPISSREGEAGEEEIGNSDTQPTTNGKRTRETNITTTASGSGTDDQEREEEEPVIQSAVMLRFGAEVPSFVAAGKCGRTVQFPIPDDWNDSEVRVRSHETQMSVPIR